MRLVYTGRFYAGVRTPLPLLRALAELNDREPLAGARSLVRRAACRGVRARRRGARRRVARAVPRPRAAGRGRAAAADADVLLVIDAPSDGPSVFLPSKLIDYLPFRKPILGLTPEPGASARLLRRLGCPVAPPDDVDAIASALAGLVRRWREGTLAVGESFDGVAAEFDIEPHRAASPRRADACLPEPP